MNRQLIFIEPLFKHNKWGGRRLEAEFGYELAGKKTGECWGIAAHKNGDCLISTGKYKGMLLSKLWHEQPWLFGNCLLKEFPVLIKIIDAEENLSIQVHPSDTYVNQNRLGMYGKTECWYIIDCLDDANIILGHNAKTRKEFMEMAIGGKWEELVKKIPIRKGDFLKVNSGTLHAVTHGTFLVEIQQNCDITYRVYDYNRMFNGKYRELHLKQALEVIHIPDFSGEDGIKHTTNISYNMLFELADCGYYKVYKLNVNQRMSILQRYLFIMFCVIEGKGIIDGCNIYKGEYFIVPFQYGKIELDGNLQMIIVTV